MLFRTRDDKKKGFHIAKVVYFSTNDLIKAIRFSYGLNIYYIYRIFWWYIIFIFYIENWKRVENTFYFKKGCMTLLEIIGYFSVYT